MSRGWRLTVPEQPGDCGKVTDTDDYVWAREDNRWRCGQETHSWIELVVLHGPLVETT
jgi:hypothetical protein